MKKIILSAILGFLLYQPIFGQSYIGKPKHIASILANIRQFSADVVAGNAEKIGNAYTEDAKIFPTNRDILIGKDTITQYWQMPQGVSIIAHKITPIEIKVKGSEAYDYGYYEGTTRQADGKEASWKGKYVILWKKIGNDWKIYVDIWNRIQE